MKDFSHFVLESTLDLAVKAMPHDVRAGKCVEAIRRCLDSSPDPEHDDELRSAVTVLLEIALQQHQFLIQFLIAARFLEIARQRLALMRRECELKKAPAACPTAAAPFICLSSCIASC